MIATAPGTRIELPRWYASVARAGVPHGDAAGPADVFRAGALTVHGADLGCDLASDAQGATVVFDGYLFDRRELARELGLPQDSGDAEIVRAAYARWGVGLYDRLDGSYLAAIWDPRTRTLLLGHDALGRHPVFYAVDGNEVLFSANILALARSGRVSARPNRLSLALSALAFWPEAGQTFYDAIGRVRPGHYLEVTPTRVAEHQYWEPMPRDDEPLIPEREVHERFEPAISEAVRRCLALDPHGIMLSGGVDSVTIAAIAAPLLASAGKPPLVSVSGRTGYRLSHEEEMQSKVADALHMPMRVSTTIEWIAGRNPLAMSLDMMPELPAPTDVWWVGTYTEFYRRTAAEGLNVLLTGAGGDNWLGVADAHAADLMRQLKLAELYAFMKAGAGTGGSSMRTMARRLLWQGGLRWHLDSAWAKLAPRSKDGYHRRKWQDRLPPWLAPDTALRAELLENLLARRSRSLGADRRAPRNYYLHSLRTVSNPFMHHESETAFHVETQCGLRLLSPYHDRRLVTFFNRIPPKVLIHGARYKGLLRPVVARRLPGLGLEDQRKDYPVDLQERKLQEMRASMGSIWPTFSLAKLDELGILQSRAFRDATGDAEKLTFAGLARLFTMMSAERWVAQNTSA
jgi:asparagine synthetase B (glutamine-hydrolysing)